MVRKVRRSPKKLYTDLLKFWTILNSRTSSFPDTVSTRTTKAMADCCWNMLYNPKIVIPETDRKRLLKSRATIMKLADSAIPLYAKKDIIQQSGGLFASLVPILLSTLGALFE